MKKTIFFILSMLLAIPVQASQWQVDAPDIDTQYVDECFTEILGNQDAVDRVVSNYRRGCEIRYNSTTSFDVLAGEVVLSNSDGSVRLFNKNTSTTNTTPTISSSTTYYVYAVSSLTSTETFSIEVSTSPTTPSGTYYRRLGSFYSDSSSYITEIANDDNSKLRTYDSGWFSISATTEYTKAHNLGTTKIIPIVYFASSSNGTIGSDGFTVTSLVDTAIGGGNAYNAAGIGISDITTNSLSVRTASQVAFFLNSNGTKNGGDKGVTNYTSGYCRVIAIALD